MSNNERYSRQMILPGFGLAAQEKLRAAKVLLVGLGGLGCPALQYLVGAGVGSIGIMDADKVSISNLHRQLLYSETDIGQLKTTVAAKKILEQNAAISIEIYAYAINKQNALQIIKDYDLVIDGTDNFSAKYLINDACVLLNKPWIYGAVYRYEGQVSVFNLGSLPLTQPLINYRDIFPQKPYNGEIASCEAAGVLGVIPGIIGTMQAAEAIKIITGIGKPLYGRMFNYNLLEGNSYEIEMVKIKDVPTIDQAFFNTMNADISAVVDCDPLDIDIEEIDTASFIQLRTNPNVFVLDVRERHEYPAIDFSHAQIPMSELQQAIFDLPEKELCIICHQGIRSIYAGQLIRAKRNLKVYSLKGGLTAYFNKVKA
jgi:molybdopterin/thiamine biosynthesis adenylyltransferase/rhodanese-related sulfurtransferase